MHFPKNFTTFNTLKHETLILLFTMNKKLLLPFVFLLFVTSTASAQKWVEMMEDPNVNFYDVQKEFYSYYVGKTKLEETEPRMDGPYSRFKSWERYMEPRVYPTGIRPDPKMIYSEWLKQKALAPTNKLVANWSLIGPSVIPSNGGGAGKVNCVAIDPINTQNIWIGTSGGGIWNSTNGGATWSCTTDQQLPSLVISDIAIHPTSPNILYVSLRQGIFKSTDAGVTWFDTGLNKTCYRIEIDPANPNTIISSCVDGLYRTTDAGVTWTQVTTITSSVNNVDDIEFNPGNSNIVYACEFSAIKRSADNGLTWTTITAGLPTTPTPYGIKLAVSPASPNHVYALLTSYSPPVSAGFYGLYRSTDAGLTWTNMSSSPNILGYDITGAATGGQGAYCMSLAVSPLNANEVYVGGINLWKSTNGGVSWTNKSDWGGTGTTYVHADQQDLKFQPGSGTILYSANDGGVNVSTNAGNTWTDLSDGLAIMEIYNLSSSATNPNVIVVGAQDNGTNKKSSTGFSRINYGDGLDCIIDYTDSNTIYSSYQNGAIFRSIDGGATNVYISPSTSYNFQNNYSMNPLKPKTLYAAFNNIYRSYNRGATWTAITSGLYPTSTGGGFLIPVIAAPSDTNTIYVARFTELYKTTNGGISWTTLTSAGVLPDAYITGMAVDPTDANKVWITYTSYLSHFYTTSNQRVFKTTDGGLTWTNITYTGLPFGSNNCILHHDGPADALYVGTDLGVYYLDNTMSSWVPYTNGIPNVRVTDLDIQQSVGKIRAATYGRGIWESDLNLPVINTNDAGTLKVVSPVGTICTNTFAPVVELKNFGSATLTSATIKYQVDAGAVNTFLWTGSLPSFSTTNVTLPSLLVSAGNHVLKTYTILPNGVTDTNAPNDSATSSFYFPVGLTLPYSEGFESTTFPPPGVTINNADSWITWQRTTAASYAGSASAFMDNMNYFNDGMIDEVVLPYFDFPPGWTYLNFKYAYQLRDDPIPTAYYSDTLEVEVSTDCGNSWTVVYKKFDLPLVTTVPTFNQTVLFVPTSTSQWASETIDLNAFNGNDKVLIKFQNVNGRGNSLYLDNINITNTPLGVETNVISKIEVYPNPNNGIFTLSMQNGKGGSDLEIYNVLGKLISSQKLANGTNVIDISNQASGMYFYKVKFEGKDVANGKLMVK